jgi:hypothetical protein
MLIESVGEDDFRAIARKLIEMAKGGDLAAIRELLDRLLGKPLGTVAVDQTDELEFRTRDQMKAEILERLNALKKNRGASEH